MIKLIHVLILHLAFGVGCVDAFHHFGSVGVGQRRLCVENDFDSSRSIAASRLHMSEVAALSTSGDVVPKNTSKQLIPKSTISVLLASSIFLFPQQHAIASTLEGSNEILISSSSIVPSEQPNSVYEGYFADPLHPYCIRNIDVSPDGTRFTFTGSDVGNEGDPIARGCSQKEQEKFGSRTSKFDGIIKDDGTIYSELLEGHWESAGTNRAAQKYADVDGIRLKNNNKWVKLEKAEDVLTFPDTYKSSNGMNPILEEVTKWVFVLYIVGSLAAGAVELFGRYLTISERNQ